MKVVVTGAAGKQGRGALWYLLKQKDISQIVAADIQLVKVKELVASLGDRRLVAELVNLSAIEGAAKVVKGADVVVNCAYEGYITDDNYVNLELAATKAALKAGVNYVGLGGSPPAPEQLALSQDFERKGLLAILEMGSAPGLTQIMAAYAINKLDRVDSVDMKSGCKDLVPPEEHSRPLPWTSEDKAMVELHRWRTITDSVSYEDGKLHYHSPRADREVFEFREPIGAVPITQTPGAAVICLSRSFPDIKKITFKTGGYPDLEAKVDFLHDIGFFANKPISIRHDIVWPWEVLMTLVEQLPAETKPPDIRWETRAIIRGEKAGKEVEYSLSSLSKEGQVARAGLCAAIAAVLLGRGQTKGKGVLMPEVCIPPEQYLDELSKNGEDIEISRKVRL